ncbi:uncharacterized protein LOC143292025 [Babylonia areolata]|uniref:uncharacterized protein LOC143292025 n=1 Tax=Babylonia areolata TaxID=304850 RepID=UPI003FD065FB
MIFQSGRWTQKEEETKGQCVCAAQKKKMLMLESKRARCGEPQPSTPRLGCGRVFSTATGLQVVTTGSQPSPPLLLFGPNPTCCMPEWEAEMVSVFPRIHALERHVPGVFHERLGT